MAATQHQLAQCLHNNQFSDAALSAMSCVLLHHAAMEDKDFFLNKANYFWSNIGHASIPEGLPDITLRDTLVDDIMLNAICAKADKLVHEVAKAWRLMLDCQNYAVVANTVALGIIPRGSFYSIRLMFCTVDSQYKGKTHAEEKTND